MAVPSVFVSYSHADREWLDRLQVYLRSVALEQGIEIWDDTKIAPGMMWKKEVGEALQSATAAVLLVSADFLTSNFIREKELPALLSGAREQGTKILPVIVGPCGYHKHVLSEFQAVNDPSQPLITLSRGEQEKVFYKVAESIEATIEANKVKELELKFKKQEIQVEKQQEIINQLVVYSMAFYLYHMLEDFYRCENGLLTEYLYRDVDHFARNLRWLRDHGYIEMLRVGRLQHNQNIAQLVKLTPVGRFYIDLRRKYEAGSGTEGDRQAVS